VKTKPKTAQNRKGYKSCAYFHYFHMQNENGWANRQSETFGAFVRQLYRYSKKIEVKACIVASGNVLAVCDGKVCNITNLFPFISHSILGRFRKILQFWNRLGYSKMLIKFVRQCVQNYESYYRCTYFDCLRLQNENHCVI
jgi:hypothetical protein